MVDFSSRYLLTLVINLKKKFLSFTYKCVMISDDAVSLPYLFPVLLCSCKSAYQMLLVEL